MYIDENINGNRNICKELQNESCQEYPQLIQVDYSARVHVPDMLASVAENIDEGLCIIDETGRLLFANPAFLKMIDNEGEHLGQLLTDVMPHNERFKLEQNLKRILQGERLSLELSMPTANGQDVFLLLSSGPCQTRREGNSFFLQFTDISEIRRAEAEKLYLMEQILSNRHIDRLGSFAGGISHEFNNILQVIKANAEYCQLALQIGSGHAEKLTEIVESTNRAGRMLKQLLTFSRNQLDERCELRISELARRVISLAALRSEKQVDCSLEILTENDLIVADEMQMEQVLSQLLGNAMQSLPEQEGRIRFRITDAEEQMMERLSRQDASEDHYLLLEVDDNGIGIPGENIDRVFDPFFTTRCVGQGTGLGLAMALGIVSSHEGVIWAGPSPLGGTRIRVLLKRLNPRVRTKARQAPRSQRVLLVDDEDVIVRLGKRMLSRAGVDVLATSDPQEAWQLLKADPGAYSMLITDQNMPDCNGLDLAELARAGNPDIRIVLCTGYIPDLDNDRISFIGIDAVLAKPFDVHEMARMVQRLLPSTEDQITDEDSMFSQSA